MADPTAPTPPDFIAVGPASDGPVNAGIKPYPALVDPGKTGVPLWDRRAVRDALVDAAVWAIAKWGGSNPFALFLRAEAPALKAFVETGSK